MCKVGEFPSETTKRGFWRISQFPTLVRLKLALEFRHLIGRMSAFLFGDFVLSFICLNDGMMKGESWWKNNSIYIYGFLITGVLQYSRRLESWNMMELKHDSSSGVILFRDNDVPAQRSVERRIGGTFGVHRGHCHWATVTLDTQLPHIIQHLGCCPVQRGLCQLVLLKANVFMFWRGSFARTWNFVWKYLGLWRPVTGPWQAFC